MQRTYHGGAVRSWSSRLMSKTRSLFQRPIGNRHARRQYRKCYGDHHVQPLEPRVLLSATLGGDAWYDLNSNAINDAGDTPVAAMVVNLLDDAGNFLDTTDTASDGSYSFPGIAAGDYIVEFISPLSYSFVVHDTGADDAVDSDANVVTGRSGVITLADLQVVDHVDAGLIPQADAQPNDVYVDDDWDAIAWGDDPDGLGPATAMGFDAFYSIQQGVDAVADAGTVHVYDGTYYESVYIIGKDMTITGVSQTINGVRVDAQDTDEVFNIYDVDNLTIEYLIAMRGNDDVIDITDSGTVTLESLIVLYADEDGIDAHYTDELIIKNTKIQYTLDDGVSLYRVGTATLENVIVSSGNGTGIVFEDGDLLDVDGLTLNYYDDYGIETDGVDEVDIYDATIQYTGDSSMELYYGCSITLDTVDVSYTDGWGFDIYDWCSTDMTDVTVMYAYEDGMWIDYVDDVNLTRVTAQYNDLDGIYITDAVDITLLDVNSSFNFEAGLHVEIAESLSDTNGVYTENEDSGIWVTYVMGDSVFTRTTATNNNTDFDDDGVGLEIYGFPFDAFFDEIIDVIESFDEFLFGLPPFFLDLLPDSFLDYDFDSFPFSVGGSVTINGGTFSDTDGNPFAGNVNSQLAGIVIMDINGDVTIQEHDDGNDIQTPAIIGNDEIGVVLYDIAGNINISDAAITDNYGEGLDIDNAYNVDIANTTFDSNNGYGMWMTNVADVTLTDVIAQFNHMGLLVTGADSLVITDGLFADNNTSGMQLNNVNGLLAIAGTTIRDNGSYGLWLTDQENIDLTQLTLTGNDVGVFVENFIHALDLTNSFINDNRVGIQIGELLTNFGYTIFDNDLSGNTEFAIVNNDTAAFGATAPIDAAGNWFGTVDQNDISAMNDGLVDFSYYLAHGTDTSAYTGFQGDFATLYATGYGSQIQSVSRLQEAVDHVDDDGTVIANTTVYDGDVTVNADKTVQGIFAINGNLTLLDNAVLVPGNSPGNMNVSDDLTGQAGTTLVMEINGLTPIDDHDILFVSGDVTLGDMTLQVTLGYVPDTDDTITLINNQGVNAVNGTFAGLPEGTVITLNGYDAMITYLGGDGNDVELVFMEQNVAPTAGQVNDVAVEDGGPVIIAYNADDANADDDASTLNYNFLTTPTEGSVTDSGDGTFTFDPGTDFQDLGVGESRQVSFTYQATDTHGADSGVATIIITVSGTNDFPVAAPNLAATEYDTPIDIDVLANDVDIDGDDLHVSGFGDTPWDSTVTATTTLGATVSINPDGTVHYDPTDAFDSLSPGQTVRDSIRYFAEDPYGLYDRHIIFIDVTRPVITIATASFTPDILPSSAPKSLSLFSSLGSNTVLGGSTINQAALAFVSQQAQLRITPLPATGSHWLDSLNGDDDDKDASMNLLDVEAE